MQELEALVQFYHSRHWGYVLETYGKHYMQPSSGVRPEKLVLASTARAMVNCDAVLISDDKIKREQVPYT